MFRNAVLKKHKEKVWLHFMELIIVSSSVFWLLVFYTAMKTCIVCRQTADCGRLNTLIPHHEYLGPYALKHIALLILLSTYCLQLSKQPQYYGWVKTHTNFTDVSLLHSALNSALFLFYPVLNKHPHGGKCLLPPARYTVSYSSDVPMTAISDWLGTPIP